MTYKMKVTYEDGVTTFHTYENVKILLWDFHFFASDGATVKIEYWNVVGGHVIDKEVFIMG